MSTQFQSNTKEQIIHGAVRDIHLSQPVVHVDNQARGRSGHMTHAMLELASGKILDFNSNCSAIRGNGHSVCGWVEYRYSEDGGETFGPIHEFPYSKESLLEGIYTISVEKAVVCDDNTIVALCLRNAGYDTPIWCEPWDTPYVSRSEDGGRTWSEPVEMCPYPGRIYDALYKDGAIYVLEFCNEHFIGSAPEHQYRIFKSDDNGKTFYEHSVVGMEDTTGLGYGAMTFLEDDRLIVYGYDSQHEEYMPYAISADFGKTWTETGKSCVGKKIRNPQIGILDGQYILHGRAGAGPGFVLYTSADGIHWDEGHLLDTEKHSCYYSNNVVVHSTQPGGKDRLLVQFSETYESARVNVMHMMIESC